MARYYPDKPTIHQIKNIPLFAKLGGEMLSKLQDYFEVREYSLGENIIYEGLRAEKIYFILEGSVQVVKNNNLTGQSEYLDELTVYEYFGEMPFIDKGHRAASVVAVSKLVVAELAYNDCLRIFSQYPEIALSVYKELAHELSERLRKLNTKYVSVCNNKGSRIPKK